MRTREFIHICEFVLRLLFMWSSAGPTLCDTICQSANDDVHVVISVPQLTNTCTQVLTGDSWSEAIARPMLERMGGLTSIFYVL